MAAATLAATFFPPVDALGDDSIDLSTVFKSTVGLSKGKSVVPYQMGRCSSNDPNGGDEDCGVYLRDDGLEHVLVDIEGPGVIRSLWVEKPQGYLRFYWDGAQKPQLEALWSELAKGAVTPIEYPFVYAEKGSSEIVFPLPFEKGMKVTLSGQSFSEHSLDYQLFPEGAVVQSWWPGNPLPNDFQEIRAGVVEAIETPHLLQWGTESWESDEELLYHTGREITFSPSEDLFVREVVFLQSGDGPIPDGLMFEIKDGQKTISVPWNALTGVWQSNGNQASIYTGSHGRRSWFRYPFFLGEGDRLSFSWDKDQPGEVFGQALVRYDQIGQRETGSLPRLGVYTVNLQEEETARIDVAAAGKALQANFRFQTLNQPAVREADIRLLRDGAEGLSWETTSLAGLVKTSRRGVSEPFSIGFSGLSVADDQTIAGYSQFTTQGLPFGHSLSMMLDVPSCTSGTLVLITSEFNEQFSDVKNTESLVARSQSQIGKVVSQVSAENSSVYQYYMSPLGGVVSPALFEVFPEQNECSGTFQLDQQLESLPHLRVSLDLPFGWKGQLSQGEETKDVGDIGWPWFDYYSADKGLLEFQWKVFPPSDIPGGEYIAQLRAEAELPDGGRQVLRRAVSLQVAPRNEPDIELIPGLTDDGLTSVTLPSHCRPEPGDKIYALATYNGSDACGVSTVTLSFEMGSNENSKDYDDPPSVFLPPDGEVFADLKCDGSPHWIAFPVGKYQSWFGKGKELVFTLEGLGKLDIDRVQLFRHPASPEVEGWSRRIPYVEMPREAFHLPRCRLLLQKKRLREAMEVAVGGNNEQIDPVFRPANYLENVQAGNLIWRFADPPRRYPNLVPSHSFEFLASHIGSRIKITDPKLAGVQFIGIEFGYGPDCGRVGIRDCEGRLVVIQDLFLPKTASVPQWTWISLPYPNRDGWIYLESLGEAPCSLGQKIALQKVMVVGNIEN